MFIEIALIFIKQNTKWRKLNILVTIMWCKEVNWLLQYFRVLKRIRWTENYSIFIMSVFFLSRENAMITSGATTLSINDLMVILEFSVLTKVLSLKKYCRPNAISYTHRPTWTQPLRWHSSRQIHFICLYHKRLFLVHLFCLFPPFPDFVRKYSERSLRLSRDNIHVEKSNK